MNSPITNSVRRQSLHRPWSQTVQVLRFESVTYWPLREFMSLCLGFPIYTIKVNRFLLLSI